ncbi:MAG TPA: glycosyltransferase family 4 protein, partial [Roseiflexaceae bacterium]|nr:glycosyltransferase family 4 protein [Roseiflexaceae bacterium]
MNIGYYNLTTTTKHGGVESFVWEVARRMADAGHRVTIYGGRGDVLRDYPQLQIRQYRFIAREVWGRSRILRRSLNLLKLLERLSMAATALPDLRRAGHDLIQISKPYDLPVVAAARYRGPRLVYNSQGTDFFSGDRFFRRTIDAAFACSRYNAAMVEARYRIPLDVSYNGFDEQRFHPQPADAGLRARL